MRSICMINQKGGVGKTTSALNMAAGLSRSGKKVLLLDIDPQSNIELSIKLDASWTIYDFLFEGVALSECINNAGTNFDLVRGDDRLLRAEHTDPESILGRLRLIDGYDYVIFDCGPSMSAINRIALMYSKEAMVPTTTDYLGYESVVKMSKFLKEFSDLNDVDIKLSKVIPTFFDVRNKICSIMLERINNEFYQHISSPVRINSKLKEAPMKKMSIFKYDPKSTGAKDYWALVQSVISDEQIFSGGAFDKGAGVVAEEEEE